MYSDQRFSSSGWALSQQLKISRIGLSHLLMLLSCLYWAHFYSCCIHDEFTPPTLALAYLLWSHRCCLCTWGSVEVMMTSRVWDNNSIDDMRPTGKKNRVRNSSLPDYCQYDRQPSRTLTVYHLVKLCEDACVCVHAYVRSYVRVCMCVCVVLAYLQIR